MGITNEINDFYYHMALYELQVMNGDDLYDGLSYNSILYLNVISQMQDCTVSKIADALKITKSAVTLKVNELVKQGAVVKTQSREDRRVYDIKINSRLEKIFCIYDQVFEKIELDLGKKYSKEQLETFREILHTISGYEWRHIKNE